MTDEIAANLAYEVVQKALKGEYQSSSDNIKEAVMNFGEEYHAVFTVFHNMINLRVCRRNRKLPDYSKFILYDRKSQTVREDSTGTELFGLAFNPIRVLHFMEHSEEMLGI